MTSPKFEIVPTPTFETTREEHEWQPPTLGSWWWVKGTFAKMETKHNEARDADDNIIRETVLACCVELGSNYAEVKRVGGSSYRIHFDHFYDTCEAEPDPGTYLNRKVDEHKNNVRELMHEIQRVTALLGIVPRDALGTGAAVAASQALASVSTADDIKSHKTALITAKDKTLPDLFKLVKAEHEAMAVWMGAELMPMEAQLEHTKGVKSQIEDRIFTVELYAGLTEDITTVRKGKPAHNDEPVHLFQRQHFMDEECLINYQAGGMHFGDLKQFDKWIAKPENSARLLPKQRCVVAFKVRRFSRKYDWDNEEASIVDFINFQLEGEEDKRTYLYVRNGQQIFRIGTEIDFGPELFPDVDQDVLFNDQAAWIYNPGWPFSDHNQPHSQRQYEARWDMYRYGRRALACKLRAWRRAGKPDEWWEYDAKFYAEMRAIDSSAPELDPEALAVELGRLVKQGKGTHGDPSRWYSDRPEKPKYVPFTTDSVFYDDVMRKIEQATKEHNRIAVVLQGLLDRSPVFNPHPPYRLWTAEGFQAGIKLVYDQTRAIAPTDEPPDFEGYRAQLNSTIKEGSITVGQEDVWERAEARKYNERRARDWRSRSNERERTRYRPHGNPGPGLFAKVKGVRGGKLKYKWIRTQQSDARWQEGEFPTEINVAMSSVLNVSAYTPGDFRMFFDDPRTRANYYKWAPFLLAAEDFHAGKVKAIGHVLFGEESAFELDHSQNRNVAKRARDQARKIREAAEAAERAREEVEDADNDDDENEDDTDDEETWDPIELRNAITEAMSDDDD